MNNNLDNNNIDNNKNYMASNNNNNRPKTEKELKQEAGQKTAHVAGRTAARYYGGEVGGKIYDAASKTKLGQAVEKKVGNKIAKTPGLGNINKKLNDSGAIDKADKAADIMGSGKSSGAPGGTSGAGNSAGLKSLNKGNNKEVPEALKNKHNGQHNNFNKSNNKSNNNSDDDKEKNNDNNDNNDNDSSNDSESQKSKRKLILSLLAPMLIWIIVIVLVLFLIFSLYMSVISSFSWFINLFHHNSSDATSYEIYNENSESEKELLQAERDYMDAIVGSSDGTRKGIIKEYQEKYGVTIDWYLLNATITYRYTIVDGSKLYTSDGDTEISDEELEERLKELEKSESSEEGDSTSSKISVDYTAAKKKIETVAALMVSKEGESYIADSSRDGIFYNKLLESEFLKSYYKPFLKDNEYETRKKLVDNIFDYADTARELLTEPEAVSGGAVNSTSVVYLQSCKEPRTYNYKNIGPYKVYDNKLVNEGTSYPLYLSLRDYIKGVIYRENFSTDEKYREAIKVQAIMALSFLIKDSNSGFDMKTGEMYFPTETCRQATCDPNYGCTSVSGVASYTGTDRGSGTKHRALNETEQAFLDSVLDEVFGMVLVKKGVTSSSFSGSKDLVSFNYCASLNNVCSSCKHGSCVGQDESNVDSASGMDYKAIFQKYFTALDYDIINITEGLYFSTNGNFNGTVSLNEEYHYHQGDSPWGSQTLCDSGLIKDNGCNITSAAIAISLLTNQKITPKVLNDRQNDIKTCNRSERSQMISDFAKLYGLNASFVNKNNDSNVQDIVSKLASGKYVVIARLGENSGRYKTSSGHYIVLVGAKNENNSTKVLVWDPGSSKSERDNYWADLNDDIYGALKMDPSFIVIGR